MLSTRPRSALSLVWQSVGIGAAWTYRAQARGVGAPSKRIPAMPLKNPVCDQRSYGRGPRFRVLCARPGSALGTAECGYLYAYNHTASFGLYGPRNQSPIAPTFPDVNLRARHRLQGRRQRVDHSATVLRRPRPFKGQRFAGKMTKSEHHRLHRPFPIPESDPRHQLRLYPTPKRSSPD